MSQLTYTQNLTKGFNGQKADSRFDMVESLQAAATIPLGRGVCKQYGSDVQCRLPVENQSVLTDDAGTFTAGSISVTVNGTVVTQAWGTDKNTTLTALAAAIQAAAPGGVYSAVYSSGSHTITLKTRNTGLTVTVDLSGVTGTMAAVTVANSSLDSAILGIALCSHIGVQGLPGGTGVVNYAQYEAVNVLRQGAAYVYVEETVTSDDTVYCRVMANGVKLPGMFGKSSDSSKCIAVTGARFVEGASAGAVAKIEINLPQ